jgi:hypothetical protein
MDRDNKLELPYYNNTNYPLAVKNQLDSINFTDDEKKQLHYHQFVVKEFFTRNIHQRGILICHGMGQGKTRLSVAIANHYRLFDKRRKIIVLLPKSLEGNFLQTIEAYTNDMHASDAFKFISLNASNMFKQMSSIDKTKDEIDYEKRLGDFMSDIAKHNSLDNALLIIDEAHNLFNAITNGAKNAVALYDLIMNSRNLKLIFLTGTPIVNDPFELVPCYNMLSGRLFTALPNNFKGGSETKLQKHGKTIRDIIKYNSQSCFNGGFELNNGSTTNYERFRIDVSDDYPFSNTYPSNSTHRSIHGSSHEDKFEDPSEDKESSDHDNMINEHMERELQVAAGINSALGGDDDEVSSDESINNAQDNLNNTQDNLNNAQDDLNNTQVESHNEINAESTAEENDRQFTSVDKDNDRKRKLNKSIHRKQSSNKKTFAKKQDSDEMTTLFSESVDEFSDYFIDRENKTIKNKDKFTNRIFGLSSYFGDLYFESASGKPGFPKKLETIIEKIPMGQTQFSRYISARENEREETKKGFKGKDSRFSASSGGSSTYRVKTRQISNYCIPENALGPVRGMKAREKFIHKISDEDLKNTDEYSRKMGKILSNIKIHTASPNNKVNENKWGPGLVYSQFVSGEGLGIFARVLDVNGYQNILTEKDSDSGFDIEDKSLQRTKRYAILSGDIDPEQRVELIKKFNQPENTDGSIISLLLLSGAVAEGIDLKRIRHVHIMEPFWNYARINQVETRAIRYKSHVDLPIDKQNVQVYIYLSDYPENYPKKKIIEPTTDVELYEKSINNMQIINTFMLAIAESSIDCTLHYPKHSDVVKKLIKCKLCAPDNLMMFHPLLKKDMELPSNCHPYTEKKVKVNEIIFDSTGEKYYYTKNPDVNLFLYNKKLKGYTPMPRSYPYYGDLMSAILSKVD